MVAKLAKRTCLAISFIAIWLVWFIVMRKYFALYYFLGAVVQPLLILKIVFSIGVATTLTILCRKLLTNVKKNGAKIRVKIQTDRY